MSFKSKETGKTQFVCKKNVSFGTNWMNMINISSFINSSDKVFDLKPYGKKLIIVKGVSALYLISRKCSHNGLPLTENRTRVRKNILICKWHNCRFCLVQDSSLPSENILPANILPVNEKGNIDLERC